ncbi:amidohydrolase [Tenacibaculum sp. UWU-22]|uniref:amidohydrolase n=1 Tax=Tenacibaculum sp. UWU-22 TaxID=3234187 RepID=UPI0034DACD31
MKKAVLLITLSFLFITCSSNKKQNPTAESNDNAIKLYHGGDIITMEGEEPQYVEAIVTDNDKIAFVGTLKDAESKYPKASKKNLYGHTLLPAFIDGHGHMMQTAVLGSMMANIMPPPDGSVKNFDKLIQVMNDWKNTDDGKSFIKETGWIVGNGYDDSQLDEKDHPTADILDKISTDVPVLVLHQSGHLSSINHKAMEVLGLNENTPNPSGGHRRKLPDGKLSGVLEENANIPVILTVIGKISTDFMLDKAMMVQNKYMSYGYLTVQDGRTAPQELVWLKAMADQKKFVVEVAAYPDMTMSPDEKLVDYIYPNKAYVNNFRIAGVKLTLDGSPQGKTAWLTHAYHTPPTGEDHTYAGRPIMSDEKSIAYVKRAFKNKWQILCHTNGDAATDQYMRSIKAAQEEFGYDDHRTVIVHGQTMREDQLKTAADLGCYITFYPAHTFYWGDWHVESVLGHPRADYISPTHDAVYKYGINITSHHDSPVIPCNSMRVLDATVNRVTRSGYVLGPDQRLTVFDGLRTLTIWAANQYFEENKKGTLSVGKVADLVILDKNPLKVDPLKIHTITIDESIKKGRSVYKKNK